MSREAKALEVSPEAIGALLEGFGVSGVQVRHVIIIIKHVIIIITHVIIIINHVIIIITHVFDTEQSPIVKGFEGFWVILIFVIMRNRRRICLGQTLFDWILFM